MENIETPSYSNIKNKKVYHTFFHSKQSLGLLHTDQSKTFSQNLLSKCFFFLHLIYEKKKHFLKKHLNEKNGHSKCFACLSNIMQIKRLSND